MDEWTDIYLNDDGNFREASDGDAQLVTGNAAVFQDLKHELETVKGSYLFDEEYGSELIYYLQRENDELAREELKQDIEDVIKRHPRIVPDSVSVAVDNWNMREIWCDASFRFQDAAEEEAAALQVQITVDGVRVIRSD